MRGLIVFFLLVTLTFNAPGATPELGKDALRKLVKLPTISFEPTWAFDIERGFSIGSQEQDVHGQITALRKQSKPGMADAETYLRMAELYSSVNDPVNARKTFSRAADLFRKRVESQPDDGLLLASFGRALHGAGKLDEAESTLRNAARLAPKEWKCQVALGRLLDAAARRDTYADRPASDKISLTKRELTEAGECFDRAATLAPDESEVFFRRGLHRCLETSLLNEIHLIEGLPVDEVLLNSQFSQSALTDLQRASRLLPADYTLIGSTAMFEIYVFNAHQGRVNWADFSWSSLPEKSQRSIRDALARLANLGQNLDPHQAAGALEVLGILQGPALHESRNCIGTLRRAVALDPSREQAWEALAATLAQLGRYDDLLAVCQDRLRQKDTARGHLLLAKTFEKLHQWDDSESEIMEALRMAPNSFSANLAEAALVLRRGQSDDTLNEANTWLTRSERLLGETPATERTTQLIVDFTLTRSIYYALTDQLDQARQWAKAVISQDKNNNRAHDILSAMDY